MIHPIGTVFITRPPFPPAAGIIDGPYAYWIHVRRDGQRLVGWGYPVVMRDGRYGFAGHDAVQMLCGPERIGDEIFTGHLKAKP